VAERDRADVRPDDRATLRNAAAGIDTLLNVLDEG
jgi:hypothetical protein